jgi:soluble lytic murein transglycosylase-like protein
MKAAEATGVSPSTILTIMDMESSFVEEGYAENAAGDVGPMQVTPVAARDARQWGGSVPADYRTDFSSNLIAGARYVLALMNHYNVPLSDLGYAYKGGPTKYNHGKITKGMKEEQKKWEERKPMFDNLIDCLAGRKN